MEISDAERRAEEAEALAAIYGDDFIRADECVWEILVPTSSSSDATSAAYFAATGERAPSRVRVRAFLPPSYPSSAAPLFELSPPEMFPFGRHEIATREMATRWAGDEVVYDVVERLRDAMIDGARRTSSEAAAKTTRTRRRRRRTATTKMTRRRRRRRRGTCGTRTRSRLSSRRSRSSARRTIAITADDDAAPATTAMATATPL